MFNLLVYSDKDVWESNSMEFDRSRVAIEYTATEISERYKDLTKDTIEELKSFPTLLVIEREETESRIGYIVDIRFLTDTIEVDFKIEAELPTLSKGLIKSLQNELDLGNLELFRTHWAIKDIDLFKVLIDNGQITEKDYLSTYYAQNIIKEATNKRPHFGDEFNTSQVFIVHGHDEVTKLKMRDFIIELGLEPIILHMQPSKGKTIIEKIEEFSNVGFAIVLYTPCDIGAKRDTLEYDFRARQNVIFEHGYFIAKLGRERVVAMVKDNTNIPNDISGVVYINFDDDEAWKKELITELQEVGYLT